MKISPIFKEKFKHVKIQILVNMTNIKIAANTMQRRAYRIARYIEVRVGSFFDQVLNHWQIIFSNKRH